MIIGVFHFWTLKKLLDRSVIRTYDFSAENCRVENHDVPVTKTEHRMLKTKHFFQLFCFSANIHIKVAAAPKYEFVRSCWRRVNHWQKRENMENEVKVHFENLSEAVKPFEGRRMFVRDEFSISVWIFPMLCSCA